MLKLIQNLDKDLFNYKVITTKDGKFKDGMQQNGVKTDVITLGKKANVFGGKALTYSILEKMIVAFQILLYNLKVIKYIYTNKIDVIYVNDLRALLYSVLAGKLLRKKIVWYIRSDVSYNKLAQFGFKYSDKIITIAHGVLKAIPEKRLKNYEKKITNIYTGFDVEGYKIFDKKESKKVCGLSPDKITIGYLGSLNERKGLDILIDSFIELNKNYNNIQLLIVGDVSPGHDDFWQEQLSKLRNKNIVFKHVPYTNNVSRAYSAMDIFVLPSRSEGLPRVLIEAMGHQLPSIATDVGGVREVITDPSLGIVIKKNDKVGLVDSLEKYINEPQIRKSVGINSYYHVKDKFSEDLFANKINELFNNV